MNADLPSHHSELLAAGQEERWISPGRICVHLRSSAANSGSFLRKLMSISRRTFVKGTAMAGGALGMGMAPRIAGASEERESASAEPKPVEKAAKPLDILVL